MDTTGKTVVRSHLNLEAIINRSPSVFVEWSDAEGLPVSYISENVRQFGYAAEEFLSGKVRYEEIILREDLAAAWERARNFREAQSPEYVQEYRILTKDGGIRWIEDRTYVTRSADDGRPLFQGILTDITGRKTSDMLRSAMYRISRAANAPGTLLQTMETIRSALGDFMDVRNFFIALYDQKHQMISFPCFFDEKDTTPTPLKGDRGMTGYVIRHSRPILLSSPEELERYVAAGDIEIVGSAPESWLGVPLRLRDRVIGAIVLQSYTPEIRFGNRELEILTFLSEQAALSVEAKRSQESVYHQATHDALTGLPNRALFSDRLRVAIRQAGRSGECVAVFMLDLDDLKGVNDDFGHATGDFLLCRIAERLQSHIREMDTVARVGGDEFFFVLPSIQGMMEAEMIARRLLIAISRPVELDGRNLSTTGSIGIAVFPTDGADAEELMRKADAAMYMIKAKGKNSFRFWGDSSGSSESPDREIGDIPEDFRRVRDAKRRSESLLRSLLSRIPDTLVEFSADGSVVAVWSDRQGIFRPRTHSEAVNRADDVLPGPAVAGLRAAMERAIATGTVQETEYERDRGKHRCFYEIRVVPKGAGNVFAFIREITQRRLREENLLKALSGAGGDRDSLREPDGR